MRQIVTVILFFFVLSAIAQTDTTNSPAQPIGGLNRLALVYYDIEFTSEQRALLEGVDIEMGYSVSSEGIAKLMSVNGVQNRALRDSLFAQDSELPGFQPEIRSGIPRESLYFMRFRFPNYDAGKQYYSLYQPFYRAKAEKEEFRILEESGSGFDFTMQGILTNHFGQADQYLLPGAGVQMGFEFLFEKGIYVGLGFDIYGNRTEKQMAVRDSMPYLRAPVSATIGLYAGKRFNRFSLQFEAYYATIGVTESDIENDIDGTDYQGFSPGLFLNYTIPVNRNRERVSFNMGSPGIQRFSFNFRGGFRGFIMDNPQASGVMLELGAGIRFGMYFIERYRFKDSYYSR